MAPTLEIHPIAGPLGAEIHGVDLRAPLEPALVEQLRAALLEHQVIFFRDQPLSPSDHAAFARSFGEPALHGAYTHVEGFPELTILEVTPESPPKIDTWHTDMTFMECPPLGSILRARVIPPRGGDTMWASLFAAWEGLSDRLQRYLDGLEAVHDFRHGFRHSLAEPGGEARLREMISAHSPVRHPVVRTHPESGRKALFVNRLFTTRLVGLSERESDAMLAMLFEHLETPEYSCRFRWRPDSIAFWDNRATLHRPVNDFWPAHRRLERITIAGDLPR
ncbi:taurine dioxygenase [Pseudenhygromyxa sp. WMMC2535]|uniref:taurine dioxygenase n=1 Tax=Pseudenhygromyxa sp. WMMC2535 TaxID=2712867 RepID=UPI0015536FC6|nr:taurine dioxygenase [Pseudenhygromyxa sp. WMMC2535]